MKEQKRLQVLNQVLAGQTTAPEAAQSLGLSLRQVRRLIAAYRQKGAAGLAHGNRGRPSPRRIPDPVRQQILELAKSIYHDYNDVHLTEKLNGEHGILVSRATVRALRRAAGQPSPRKRRPPRHRSRRPRRPQAGLLLQVDGSLHDWLEGRGPSLTLIAAIDDATNEIPAALFRAHEDAAGYFLLMHQISHTQGLPLALYADRHTILQSPKKASLQQQLDGDLPRSQFGRLLDELHVELIPALSPQAKGRIERLFGTLQDRLIKFLREQNASSLAEANQALVSFLPSYNSRFARPPAESDSAYRPWPSSLDRDEHFCFKYDRTVANDNTVSFSGHQLQIPPGRERFSYARARVKLHHHLDGSLTIHYHSHKLALFQPVEPGPPRVGRFTPAPAMKPAPAPLPTTEAPSQSQKPPRKPHKPSADHPWRRPAIAAKSRANPE